MYERKSQQKNRKKSERLKSPINFPQFSTKGQKQFRKT